jgi:transcriptional regulator with XRE-family HTH domain
MTAEEKLSRYRSNDPWWGLFNGASGGAQYSLEKRLFPDIVRTSRALLQLSQDELAECAEISRKTVIGIETGQRSPDDSTLNAVKGVLVSKGITVDIVESKLFIGIDIVAICGDKTILIEVKGSNCYDDTLSRLSDELDSVKNRLKLLMLRRPGTVKE